LAQWEHAEIMPFFLSLLFFTPLALILLFLITEERMRVAIPIFGARISPRFDFAPVLLLLTLEKGKVEAREEVLLSPRDSWRRVEKLKELEVETLICGGIDRHSRQMLEDDQIRVIPWVAGEAEEALHYFLNGTLRAGVTLWPGCGRGRKRKMGSSGPRGKF
jgi:predicted Fe-Mo cluster-binding NifX family protein